VKPFPLLLAITLPIGLHGGPAAAQFTTASPEQLARRGRGHAAVGLPLLDAMVPSLAPHDDSQMAGLKDWRKRDRKTCFGQAINREHRAVPEAVRCQGIEKFAADIRRYGLRAVKKYADR
jgi:hypothetical protein